LYCGPTFGQYLDLFLEPTKRIFFSSILANRADDNLSNAAEVDNPQRWLPRMPHPNSFPWFLEWYRRAPLDEILQIGVVLSLDAFPGFALEPGIAPARSLSRFSLFPPGRTPIRLAD